MKGGNDHTPGPRGGAVAGEMDKETPLWSPGLVSEIAAELTAESKLSLTSHLSSLAEEEPVVAVYVNSWADGCRSLKASCKPSACCSGSKPQ